MIKVHRIYLFILLQTLAAIILGLSVLFLFTGDKVSPGVFIKETNLSGMKREDVIKRIKTDFEEVLKSGHITVKYPGNNEYKIKYSEIDANIDYEKSTDKVFEKKGIGVLSPVLDGYFTMKKRVLTPVLNYSEEKLKNKVEELSKLIDRQPVNADINVKDGKIVKENEEYGLKVNPDNTFGKIKGEILNLSKGSVELKIGKGSEIESLRPLYVVESFNGAEEIISSYTTKISDGSRRESAINAALAINKVLLYPKNIPEAKAPGTFSFLKYLKQAEIDSNEENEGYNQVASTLYAAALAAGLDKQYMVRTPHKTPIDYIEPGLDARVLGNEIDFKFKNTLDHTLIIFAWVEEDEVTVAIAGTKTDKTAQKAVKVEVEQKYNPPVVCVESNELKTGETKVLTKGIEGVKVNVYLSYSRNGNEFDKKLLYSDKYEPVDSLIQIGPNTKWDGQQIK